MKIALVGTGNLLESLLAGALRGGIPREWLLCSTHTATRAYALGARYDVACTPSNRIAAEDAHLVLVGCSPAALSEVLEEIAPVLRPGAVVAVATVPASLADIEAALPKSVAAARIMPSVAAAAGHGMCGVAWGPTMLAEQQELVTTFLGSMGEVRVMPEAGLYSFGALAGSGPAYVAALIDALVAGGVELGIDVEQSRSLALEVVRGTVALLEPNLAEPHRTRSIDDVITAVGHPGGSTARSVSHLRDSGALAAVTAAVAHTYED